NDGTSVQTLSPRPYYVTDIEVDHVNGHVYYSGHQGFTGIRRMDLDGSNDIQITTHAYNGFIALDIDREKIYYTRDIYSDPNQLARSIYQVDLDGSNQQMLLDDIGPRILDIDLSNDVLYINQHGTNRSILAYDLETKVLSTVVDTTAIDGLANEMAVYQQPGGIVLEQDGPAHTINLTGITDGGEKNQPLKVTATSSNTDLLPSPGVTYTSAETTGLLSLEPTPGQHGTSTVTVTVEDAGLDLDLSTTADNGTFSRTFDVTVNPAPNVTPIAQADSFDVLEDSTGNSLNVLANDTDPNGDPLIVTQVSQASAGGSVQLGPDGTLLYTPRADFFG
ncbi:MAG: hypothetical protein GY888_11280, partial [Planctomycetaceae bacterium]|nr:hypothetical protein [Planctomycetaceae bacterium]